MELADYAEAIRFRWIGPERGIPPRPWVGAARRLRRVGIDLEVANTRLPAGTPPPVRRGLEELGGIPKMSTFAVGAIVAHGVATMPPGSVYLNVGVWHGYTFLAGLLGGPDRRCVGVDDFSEYGRPARAFGDRFRARAGPEHRFHPVDYREYFERHHEGPVGFYFWDGPRSGDDERRGLELVEPHLVEGAHILVDDVNWPDRREAVLDFAANSGGRYEVVFEARTAYNKHLTFWNGVLLLRRTG